MQEQLTCGPFQLDPGTQIVRRNGEPISLGLRGVLLLEALLKRPGEVLTKGELMDAAWSGAAVEESNLSVQIALLRKALGPSPDDEWIATIPRVGYRFLAPSVAATNRLEPNQPKKISIAVLPFANLSTDPEQAFFADGLAEEVITTLSKLSGLLVIARNSSFAYKGSTVDVRQVAAELDVRYILAGSVRKSGNRVRMAVQLADAETGGHIWAERYDRELIDVFAIQDEVTRHIVSALEVTLGPTEVMRAGDGRTRDLEALDWVLRARAMLAGGTQNLEVFRHVTGLLRQAIDRDPSYAEAYAALTLAHVYDYINRWTDNPDNSLAEARQLAADAIAQDPNLADAHAAAALVAMMGKDVERLVSEVDATLSLNPNHAIAHLFRGNILVSAGEPLAAIAHIERAMRLDPVASQANLHHLGFAYLVAGRYETAAALFRERILLVPDTDMTRGYLVVALGHLGKVDEAQRVWGELMAINPRFLLAERLDRGWGFKNPADRERLVDGARKAGIAV